MEIDSKVPHGCIISDKVMKVRIPHYELKWEMPNNNLSKAKAN